MAAHPFLDPRYVVGGLKLLGGLARGAYFDCEVMIGYPCNLSCGFCSFWSKGNPAGVLSAAEWAAVSRKLAAEGSLVISLEGGEPLLRPDLEEIVEGFARHHHPMVYTNGQAVTAARARSLFEAGVWSAAVSLDYATPAKHDAQRGREGVHASAIRALELLRDGAPRGGKQVHAFTVLMDDNLDELPALLEVTRRLEVGHQVTLISTAGWGRAGGGRGRPAAGAGARVAALAREFPHLTTFPSYLAEMDRWLAGAPTAGCRAGLQGFSIAPNGDVAPCNDRLDQVAANLLRDDWGTVKERLRGLREPRGCDRCYTACRGSALALGGGLGPRRLWKVLSDFVL